MIDNATGAMEPGEPSCAPAGKGWVIEVEDNGRAPVDILPMIFDPLYHQEPGQGTGYLNISYNIIVQKHKGEIKVFSEPGKTCFQVWLPLRLESAIAPRNRPPAQSVGEVGELAPHGD
jgi:signal transduction histidine kinase